MSIASTAVAKETKQRDLSRMGSIDYLLMTIGSCLAAFSGGMSISQPEIAWFNIQLILVGAFTSIVVRKLALRTWLVKIDGALYALALVGTFYFRADLNALMPDGGFPREVASAGWLCWMLIIGSFCTWQDSTLLFQAIPSIALFGLVGCYDTFRNVVFAFFVFLLCLATLFARAHYRQMLKQAANSGYFTRGLAPGTPVPEVETTPGLAERMREGPWRWVAGPEWALGSALVVVMISLLGAPVIRFSTQGVSGFVKVPQPPVRAQAASTTAVSASAENEVRVGRGPNRVTHNPVLEIKMGELTYLRSSVYDVFRDNGWRYLGNASFNNGNGQPPVDPSDVEYAEIMSRPESAESVPFSIRLRTTVSPVPVPGIVKGWRSGRSMLSMTPSGSFLLTGPYSSEFVGEAIHASSDFIPTEAQRKLPRPYANMLLTAGLPQQVSDLAKKVAGTTGSDYVRAEKIRQEISRRIKYNINAAATPPDKDPIEYALFESKEGYCDLYASSMVMMARAAGIPARYVTGYLPEFENKDQSGTFLVLDSDAHAWAELYFKGAGWVVFDATSGADAVPGGERGSATDNRAWFDKPLLKNVTFAMIGFGVLVAGFMASRGVRAAQKVKTPRTDLYKAYESFSYVLERHSGKRRDMGLTPDEFFTQIEGSLGASASMAKNLNQKYVNWLFGPTEPTYENVAQLRDESRSLAKQLRSEKRAK